MRPFIAALLLATTANAMPLVKDGLWLDSLPKTLEKGNGFALLDPTEADFIAAGWAQATQEQIDTRAEAQAQAAVEAEAARIAGKSVELKRAENAFLTALYGYNAAYSLGLTADDSFQSAIQKLKDSTTGERIDRIEAGLVLRTLWDVVLFHGGRWGDTQFHQEVEQ